MNPPTGMFDLLSYASEFIVLSDMNGNTKEFCQRILAFRSAVCRVSQTDERVTLGTLFSGAVMNPSTKSIHVEFNESSIFDLNNAIQELEHKAEAKAPQYLKDVKCGTIWNNATGASAGDILYRVNDVLIQVQCRFADKDGSSLDYKALVEKEHFDKNMKLVKAWNKENKDDQLRCVTVFMVGAPVKNIPMERNIERGVIIIHSENLETFLGPFSHMHTLVAAQGFIRVNELSVKGLSRALSSATDFGQEQPTLAKAIVELRESDGSFRNIDQLEDRLVKYGGVSTSGLDGKPRLRYVKDYVEKLRMIDEKGLVLF